MHNNLGHGFSGLYIFMLARLYKDRYGVTVLLVIMDTGWRYCLLSFAGVEPFVFQHCKKVVGNLKYALLLCIKFALQLCIVVPWIYYYITILHWYIHVLKAHKIYI